MTSHVLYREHSQAGFSLLEALVSLAIAALVVGGVTAVYSAHADSTTRLQAKEQEMAVLESAMQGILSGAVELKQGSMRVAVLEGSPVVDVAYYGEASKDELTLARIHLRYASSTLETSMLIRIRGSR